MVYRKIIFVRIILFNTRHSLCERYKGRMVALVLYENEIFYKENYFSLVTESQYFDNL